MSKHTPGPWKVASRVYVVADGQYVAMIASKRDDMGTAEANARRSGP